VAFRERIVPRETVEIMVNLAGPQTVVDPFRPKKKEKFRRAWVSGLQTGCLDIESGTPPCLVAASLRPAHAGPLLGIAGREITGQVVELDSILGHGFESLADRMAAADVTGRFVMFEQFLRDRLGRSRKPDGALVWAVRKILEDGGRTEAEILSSEIGWSRRHLERRFDEHVGLAPKRLSRLVRFTRVIDVVRNRDRVNWAQVALGCGFYDQAHFNHEFRAFTGVTPNDFLHHRDPSGQSILVE
jgi:AraC-like DNA-binding protein